MNKQQLIDALAESTGQTKAASESFVNSFVEVVTKNMKSDDGVKLVGFGTFATSQRKARVGRNPQTGEEIKIPAREVPVFRPGKELKELISGKK